MCCVLDIKDDESVDLTLNNFLLPRPFWRVSCTIYLYKTTTMVSSANRTEILWGWWWWSRWNNLWLNSIWGKFPPSQTDLSPVFKRVPWCCVNRNHRPTQATAVPSSSILHEFKQRRVGCCCHVSIVIQWQMQWLNLKWNNSIYTDHPTTVVFLGCLK